MSNDCYKCESGWCEEHGIDDSKKIAGCLRKRLFITEHEAIITRIVFGRKFKKDYRVYGCNICKGWHLTSRPLRHQLETFKYERGNK